MILIRCKISIFVHFFLKKILLLFLSSISFLTSYALSVSPKECFCAIVFVVIYGAFIYNCMEQQCQRVAAWDKCNWICFVVKPLGLITTTHRIIQPAEMEGNHKHHWSGGKCICDGLGKLKLNRVLKYFTTGATGSKGCGEAWEGCGDQQQCV